MQDSAVPNEIWRHIISYCDYYSNYFQLYGTSKFFKQLLDSIQISYLQETYKQLCYANILARVPFYEHHYSATWPWSKKLFFHALVKDSTPPTQFDLSKPNTKHSHQSLPTVFEDSPFEFHIKKNQPDFDVNIQTTGAFQINTPIIGYFEMKILSAAAGCSIGFSHS